MSYFSDLGLAEPILRALGSKGYSDPTPIQRQAIPALMQGRDLLGIAQTGTGKTAAFSLPSLHRLFNDPKPHKPASCRMLVLSPTRELAAQIAENIRGYAKYINLTVACVFGGVPVGKNARAMVPGVDILVATPGRLLDLIDQRAVTLRHVEIFVLDEADQMMDLGFIVPLKRVANLLPKERQSLFFSATMPKAIADLGKQFINNPVRVEVAPQSTTAERVEQYCTFVNQAEKQALLSLKLRAGLNDKSIERALVFTRTKHGADRVIRHLTTAGVEARAIHGNKSQAQRTAALQAFKSGSTPVLVATDIAARGIDVTGVSHVFNYELPNVAEQYVHRIGRTARAGADGIAISYVAPDEKPYLRDIEKLTGVKLAPLPLPEDFQKEARLLPAPAKTRSDEGDRGRDFGRGGHGGGQRREFGNRDRNGGGERGGGERGGGERHGGGQRHGGGDRDRNANPRTIERPTHLGTGARGDRTPPRGDHPGAPRLGGEPRHADHKPGGDDGRPPKRRFGNGGAAPGVGAHRNKVRRAV